MDIVSLYSDLRYVTHTIRQVHVPSFIIIMYIYKAPKPGKPVLRRCTIKDY